jgi:hypothetical protein
MKVFKNLVGCIIRSDDDNMKVEDINKERMGEGWTEQKQEE